MFQQNLATENSTETFFYEVHSSMQDQTVLTILKTLKDWQTLETVAFQMTKNKKASLKILTPYFSLMKY